jgi:hypothetical protein
MKTIKNLFFLLLLAAVMTACQEDPKDNPVLQEAFKIHKEAMAIHDEVMPQMKDLKDTKEAVQQAMNQIQIRAEEMDTESLSALQAAMASLEASDQGMRDWMANITEVPGFAHDHDHGDHDHGEEEEHDHAEEGDGHDHDHSHGADPKLTPDQILEVQKALKADMLKLKDEMEAAVTGAKQLLSAMAPSNELEVEE